MLTPAYLLSLAFAVPAVLAGPVGCRAPSAFETASSSSSSSATPSTSPSAPGQVTDDDYYYISKVTPNLVPSDVLLDAQGKVHSMMSALEHIAPKVKECGKSGSTPECRTAKQAAFPILSSFYKYDITSPEERAAVVAILAYESVEFQYDVNQAHPTTGQGTRNMQMADFNKEYAASLVETRRKQAEEHKKQFGWAVEDDFLNMNVEDMNPMEILNWLNAYDEYSFGSAAWYMRNHCDELTLDKLRSEHQNYQGYMTYLGVCIGLDFNARVEQYNQRTQYYDRALEEFRLRQF